MKTLKTVHIKQLIISLVALMLALGALSCNRYTNGPAGKNPLWKVTSDKGTVYLLGSVHLLKHSDYPFNEALEEAFYSSSKVVFELDFEEYSTDESGELIRLYGRFQDGRTLKSILNEKTYSESVRLMKARGFDMDKAEKLKPWYMAIILSVSELSSMGFKPDYGVDMYFYTKARTMGKDILALETLEYQVALFNSMSMDGQEAFVRQTLTELDTIRTDFPDIVKAWKTGDTEGLSKLLEQCDEFKETCDLLVYRRNREWVPQIERLLSDGQTSIVIAGAAHMIGKRGIVSLLRKKGYSVEQL